jgi:hypothetical protein
MADSSDEIPTDEVPIDEVAAGDIVDNKGKAAKVVHMDATTSDDGAAAVLVTFEIDGGETFDVEYPSGTRVRRFPEAKWESEQSPTPHTNGSE